MALYLLNRARTVEEVEQAAAHFKVPGQNWVYADDRGNIGYTAAMGIPRREGFDGSLPLPGWDGKHEWSGYVPTEEQPRLKNPSEGYIATANNKITDNDYPHYIGHYFATPDRVTRIRRLLEHKPKLGMDDMMSIHADVYMILAEEWIPVIKRELANQTMEESEERALEILSEWNFVADPDQVAPTIFHAFLNKMVENTFKKRLGDDLYRQYVAGKHQYNVHNVLRVLVMKGKSAWFDDPDTSEVEQLGDIVTRSFHEAVVYLKAELGDDPDDWIWGDLLTLTIYHPFGRFSKFLGWFFNIGPYPMGGSISTVNPAPYLLADPWQVFAGASQRSIFDLSGKSSLRIISTGISGNFMSSHYDDQAELWHNGAYRPFVLDRESVERDRTYTLKLVPK
jgi:penicillin amidase